MPCITRSSAPEPTWAYLSSVARLSPRELTQLAKRLGPGTVGGSVDRLRAAPSPRISAPAPAFIRSRLGAMITVESTDLRPALLAASDALAGHEIASRRGDRRPGPRPAAPQPWSLRIRLAKWEIGR